MSTITTTRDAVYVEVLQFYARQMRRLDERNLAEYAGTFTEDGQFGTSAQSEPVRTRAKLLDFLVEFHKQFEAEPVQRRHHFTMVDVEPQDDGTIRSTCYALVTIVRPGAMPKARSSCVVHDVLVREGDGLRTRSRHVEID
jgi:actinorhodin biosynthesis protein ActVIA